MQILKSMAMRCVVLLVTLYLTGCDTWSNLTAEDQMLILKPPIGSDPEQALLTLKGRFEDFRPSIFSSVEARIEAGEMQFLFHRGVPESKFLTTLFLQRGVLTATLETGELVYNDQDILSAQTVQMDGKVYLKLVVSDEAARRIGEITANNIGKVTNVVLDGFPVFNSTIEGAFSKEFKLSAPYPYREVQVIESLLDHGSLSGVLGLVGASEGMFEQNSPAEQPVAEGSETEATTAETPETKPAATAAEPGH